MKIGQYPTGAGYDSPNATQAYAFPGVNFTGQSTAMLTNISFTKSHVALALSERLGCEGWSCLPDTCIWPSCGQQKQHPIGIAAFQTNTFEIAFNHLGFSSSIAIAHQWPMIFFGPVARGAVHGNHIDNYIFKPLGTTVRAGCITYQLDSAGSLGCDQFDRLNVYCNFLSAGCYYNSAPGTTPVRVQSDFFFWDFNTNRNPPCDVSVLGQENVCEETNFGFNAGRCDASGVRKCRFSPFGELTCENSCFDQFSWPQ